MHKALTTAILAGLAMAAVPQCSAQTAPAPRELAYGSDARHRLDFWRAGGKARAPLVLFIHGGGWSSGDKEYERDTAKPAHFLGKGFAFAALNYRLVPSVPVEQQVQDVASALAYVAAHADELGIDPRRIVLVGHSSGGHLAALIGTDPEFVKRAGAAMPAAVILLDGAGLVPRIGAAANRRPGPFRTDEERKALAPLTHAAAPNAPAFLFLNAASEDLRQQAATLAGALQSAGATVRTQTIEGADHMSLSEDLGRADDRGTQGVDAFLASLPGS
jgi:arylformamidase